MTVRRATFHIPELDCAEEVRQLRQQLDGCRGIRQLDFDVLHARLTVEYEAEAISPAGVIEQIVGLGMRAVLWQSRDAAGARDDGRWRARAFLVLLSGATCGAGFLVHAWCAGSLVAPFEPAEVTPSTAMFWAARSWYLVSILIGLWFVAPRAWNSLRRLRTDMHVLMCVAVAGAVVIGQWLEAATVTFLFSLALWLEHWSLAHARRAIGALLNLTPPTARCLPPPNALAGEAASTRRLIEKRVEDVAVGEVVVVRPGEKFPLDGTVLCGNSSVNQAPLTGESIPISKQPGDGVFAGTINGEVAIEFAVTRPADETTLARIVHLVRDAQSRRATSEQWVERFAQYYTPGMVALAFAVAVIPPWLWGADWTAWFYNGLVILVIACPCALVISTPVSLVAALTAAVRHGVLVKGGRYLDWPTRCATRPVRRWTTCAAWACSGSSCSRVTTPRRRERLPRPWASTSTTRSCCRKISCARSMPCGAASAWWP